MITRLVSPALILALFGSVGTLACSASDDSTGASSPEVTATVPAACAPFTDSFWQMVGDDEESDPAWKVVSRVDWRFGAPLDALQEAQLIAAVKVSAHGGAVSTVEAAFAHVDQGEVSYLTLETAGRRYVAVEYGAGDNSYGAIFDTTSPTPAARIEDGDIYCDARRRGG